MVAHHVTRPEEKATAASSRGAGAIHAAARFALVLNALDKNTAKQLQAAGVDTADLLQVEIGKWNNGPKGNPVILRRRTAAVGPFSAPVLELFRPGGEARAEQAGGRAVAAFAGKRRAAPNRSRDRGPLRPNGGPHHRGAIMNIGRASAARPP